jgi:hypothetical protein
MKNAAQRVELVLLVASWAGAVAVASTVLRNELVWDDVFFVSSVQRIGGLGELMSMIASPFWDQTAFVAYDLPAYWRPLTTAAMGLIGLGAGGWPLAYHLLSLVAALLASAALGLVVALAAPPDRRRLGAWFALIFFAHPLSTEVMCLVANVADHLALLFMALELVALREAMSVRRRRRWLVLAGVSAFLACGSKELGVVCALGPLLSWALFSERTRSAFKTWVASIWPWVASVSPVVLFLGLRTAVLASAGRDSSPFGRTGALAGALVFGPGQALRAALVPVPQGVDAMVSSGDAETWALALLFWLGLAGLVAHAARQRRLGLGLVGLATALVVLVPSLLGVERADGALRFGVRYFDLPLAWLLVAAVPVAAPRWSALRWAAPFAALLLAVVSLTRISEWQRDLTFYRAEVEYRPDSPLMLSNLASANAEAGDYPAAEDAANLFDASARSHDLEAEIRVEQVRAQIEFAQYHDADGARRRLEAALRRAPGNLVTLLTLTEIMASSGHPEEAAARVERVLASPRIRGPRREYVEGYLTRYRRMAEELRESEGGQ